MADEAKRLGRGLAALIGSSQDESELTSQQRSGQRRAPIEFLRPNPRNPRKDFADADLAELSDSIREKGMLQPIVVRQAPEGVDIYEIIAGERRWRAAQKAGLHDVPIIVVSASDQEALELAIIENVQRADLNPLEEASGYERLTTDYGYTHAEIAKAIGKSRSHVANMVRLVKLPDQTKRLLANGKISAGHARALLSVDHPDTVAATIVDRGLTVRDVERLAQEQAAGQDTKAERKPKPNKETDPDTKALEKRLADELGLKVSIRSRGDGGELVVAYTSLDQLDMLCERLSAGS